MSITETFCKNSNRSILGSSGRVRPGLSLTTAGSCLSKTWPICVLETTRSDTRLQAVSLGTSKNVATHPVAQLANEDMLRLPPLQMTHRSLSTRTHTFHTTYDGDGERVIDEEGVCALSNCQNIPFGRTFHIKSSVLGRIITDVDTVKLTRDSYIYASGTRIAERVIKNIGSQPPIYIDATFVTLTDPSGSIKTEKLIQGDANYLIGIYGDRNAELDPFGARLGYVNPYPLSAPLPEDPNADCDLYPDGESRVTCLMPDDFDQTSSEENQFGSVPGNTCYKDGHEEDCNVVMDKLDPDTPVVEEDEFPDKSPSDSGPKSIHQNSDETDDQGSNDLREKEFQQQYTAAGKVSFGEEAGVAVNVGGSTFLSPVSSWDLQTDVLPNPSATPGRRVKVDDQQIADALASCIKELWKGIAKLNSALFSQKGMNGKANVSVLQDGKYFVTGDITNDVRTYSSQDLGRLYSDHPNLFQGKEHSRANGITSDSNVPNYENFTAWKNFTATDRDELGSRHQLLQNMIGPFKITQIHELGNSLALITGRDVGTLGNPDPDSGYQLEDCVDGILRLHRR